MSVVNKVEKCLAWIILSVGIASIIFGLSCLIIVTIHPNANVALEWVAFVGILGGAMITTFGIIEV